MNKIIYNKLVRDKIPEGIEVSGKTCEIEILSDEDYLQMLDKKLDEELAEYHQEQNIEELADLLEVLYATAKARGYSIEELEKVRVEKKKARGGFEEKILLLNPPRTFFFSTRTCSSSSIEYPLAFAVAYNTSKRSASSSIFCS